MVHKSNTTCSWGEAVSAEIMADIFSLVITVTFIHYWYSFFSVSSCFRFLSAVFQSDLLQHTKTFTHTSGNFSSAWFALRLSSTCLSKFLLVLALRPRCGESPSSGFLSSSSLVSPSQISLISSLSRRCVSSLSPPSLPPSPPFAFFSSRFSSVLLFFSSLSSFICLSSSLVRLQRVLKSWGHQETSSAARFFPPTIPLLFSLHSAFFFTTVPRSYLFASSLFWLFFFFIENFFGCCLFFLLFVPFSALLLAPHLQYNVI